MTPASHDQSISSKYTQSLIPRNSTEYAEAVPVANWGLRLSKVRSSELVMPRYLLVSVTSTQSIASLSPIFVYGEVS